MSDDGSEIDSKYNMLHPSFVIIDGLMFGLFFILYLVKLPTGNCFQSECVVQNVL